VIPVSPPVPGNRWDQGPKDIDDGIAMKDKLYRDPASGELLPERRSGKDRRAPSAIASLFLSSYRRRKRKGRRKTDSGAYVDIYDSRSWQIAIAVLVLSCLDAVLTGIHLVRGSASEANPVMNAVISRGGLPAFFGVKMAMTFFPMAIIFIHKEWTLGRYAARLCLLAYSLLTIYHSYLIYLCSR
jgi:hypothetical protein